MIRLQQLRIDKGLSVPALAERAGVTKQTIYNLEDGKSARVETLVALAEVLEARPSELLRVAVFAPEGEAA
jgi:transcriptional regulator with XRE-family HTH domain